MTDPTPETTDSVRPHTLTGDIRTHEGFHSRYLERDRTIVVYLPPGYDATSAVRYPTLYLHDGQNVFDQATSFGDEWRVDETAQALITAGAIEPVIVVGVYNAGEARVDEYTPTVRRAQGDGGHADDYGRMLVEELKPFIDATYKTFPGAANTAIGGSSLGGLLTMHLGLRYPTAFGKLAVLSPSVWWDDRVILREVAALTHKLPQRIWLDAGTREGEETIANSRLLRDALVEKGWVVGEDLMYLEADGGEHNEASWAARVGPVLEFLFPSQAAQS
ncbi:MAG: Endo,4-beta-xylanase/feruloyl esterase precursor [Gemmatimonadetes bacterium]|nr:Endo,4-beta-xylanase/feruloyl esterase precursor [Gemmatimonadota bacterium]